MAMGRFYWNEDKNRANIAFGPMCTNNDFNYETEDGDDIRLVYSELRNFILLEYSRKIIGDFYLGAVGFAWTGSIWGKDNEGEEAFERSWLPSVGVGARYMVSLEKRINIRPDYAVGVDGNQGLYFGIMEAF